MKQTYYLFEHGELKRKNNTLLFQSENEKRYLPIEEIQELMIFGEVDLNKRLLEFLSQENIPIHFFSFHENYVGSYLPKEYLNAGTTLLKQAEYYLDPNKRIHIARKIVEGSCKNILNVLKYYSKKGKDVEDCINKIEEMFQQIPQAKQTDSLMGIEGNIRDTYYQGFDSILENDEFQFQYRSRKPPHNKLNALISFGNTMLYSVVLSEIYHTKLDPRISFLHATNDRGNRLNLDIAEIFKPIIVDRIIFSTISKRMITSNSFDKWNRGIYFNDNGRKKFVAEFDKKLKQTIRNEHGQPCSYRWLIRKELYSLARHITKGEEYNPFISRW